MSQQQLTLGLQPCYRVVGSDGGGAAPAGQNIATNRAVWKAIKDMIVRSIVFSGHPDPAAPTAAQLAGKYRVMAYRQQGGTGRQDRFVSAAGDGEYGSMGDVVFDQTHRLDAGAIACPVTILVPAGMVLVVEVSQGVDTAGAGFLADIAVGVYAEPVGSDTLPYTAR